MYFSVESSLQLFPPNRSRSKQYWSLRVLQSYYCGLNSVLTVSSIYNMGHTARERIYHMLRASRAHIAKWICTRGSKAKPAFLQHLPHDLMGRHPYCNCRKTCRDKIWNNRALAKHHGQRTRPVLPCQQLDFWGYFSKYFDLSKVSYVHNQRIYERTHLYVEDLANNILTQSITGKTVNCLGRQSNKLAAEQQISYTVQV